MDHRPRTVIWMPLMRGTHPVGSISYQLFSRRPVRPEELAFLELMHSDLGDQLAKVYRNELTRNQAIGLGALNVIARALSATRDEAGIVAALLTTLGPLIPVDRVELAIRDEADSPLLRVLAVGPGAGAGETTLSARSRRAHPIRPVLELGEAQLAGVTQPTGEFRSAASVAVVEDGLIRAVLTARCRQADAYERSTLAFLQQVADQLALALRNAWSYSRLEAQRRRQEIVNAVGAGLASSLDRWSILRSLRETLSEHLEFDSFTLATIAETPSGQVAEGYVWDSGEERPRAVIPLAAAGPAREAYETGEPVLIRRSPWARKIEAVPRSQGELVIGEGVVVDVTRPGRHRRFASRSLVWVPVRRGSEVVALLSIQSYRAEVFNSWHVDVLQDVAGHVGLALANADHYQAAHTDRQRLEVLHRLERGVQSAATEEQVAEAALHALRSYVDAPITVLAYLESGRVAGYCLEAATPLRRLPTVNVEQTMFFKRQLIEGTTVTQLLPPPPRVARPAPGWPTWGPLNEKQFLSVPLFNEGRVVGTISAQRAVDRPFNPEEIQLFESAAPVIGIGLRTAMLHRANELAMANSLRLQMVAGLAGHDLKSVVENVAELARTILGAAGAACWTFDEEGRVAVEAVSGGDGPERVLRWSGHSPLHGWPEPPVQVWTGQKGRSAWTLIPLRHGERLVGALGAVRPGAPAAEPLQPISDFAQHAAIAIENARLAEETRGRIHTLEAVAAFANLDITRPDEARAAISRLVEGALAGADGAMWLLEGSEMVRRSGGGDATRIGGRSAEWWAAALKAGQSSALGRRLRSLVRAVFALPVLVEGALVGMLTAGASSAMPGEIQRLMAVLAGQTAVALSRLNLVAELARQTEMLTTVLEHSPLGVVLEDEGGDVAYVNPEVERIYGVPASSLIGAPARSLLDRPDAIVLCDGETADSAPMEVRLGEEGTVVQVRSVTIPEEAGRRPRVLRLHEDVTRERALLEARDLMLRAIGHEVRSPAAAMRWAIAGLLQWGSVLDADQRQALIAEAYEQSDRLLNLVENQLLISKLEARRFEPNRSRISLARSAEQVLTVLRSRYGPRVKAVDVRIAAGLPDAYCEPTHLDQVLTNLIGNALETSARLVRVGARADGPWLEVTVSDDGGGLAPERIRSPFEKTGSAGHGRARGGLGLGLYLCQLVVERSFEGRIWLEGTGPEGTTFKFTVPASADEPQRKARQ